MTAQQVQKEIRDSLSVKLSELGVEGFVLAGYLTNDEGRMERFAVSATNRSAAVEDGLSPIAHVVGVWAAPREEKSSGKTGSVPGTLGGGQ